MSAAHLKSALKRPTQQSDPRVGGLAFAATERAGQHGGGVFFNSVVQVRETGDFGEEHFEDNGEGSDGDPELEDDEGEEEGEEGPGSTMPAMSMGSSTAPLASGTSGAPGAIRTINSWYLEDSGRIVSSDPSVQTHKGPVPVKTSALKAASGLFVQTVSNSTYKLGRMDKETGKIFKKIYPVNQTTGKDAFDPAAPLDNPNARRALRYAGRIAHGVAGETWERIKLDLELLEEQLGANDIVGGEMNKIWAILEGMGLER